MKKIALFLLFALVFSGLGLATPAEAQLDADMLEECELVRDIRYDGTTHSGTVSIEDDDAGAFICMVNIVNRLVNMLFYVMVTLVVGLVVVGGFFILTSGGDEDKVTSGKKYITFAIIGMAIAVFAWITPNLINFLIG